MGCIYRCFITIYYGSVNTGNFAAEVHFARTVVFNYDGGIIRICFSGLRIPGIAGCVSSFPLIGIYRGGILDPHAQGKGVIVVVFIQFTVHVSDSAIYILWLTGNQRFCARCYSYDPTDSALIIAVEVMFMLSGTCIFMTIVRAVGQAIVIAVVQALFALIHIVEAIQAGCTEMILIIRIFHTQAIVAIAVAFATTQAQATGITVVIFKQAITAAFTEVIRIFCSLCAQTTIRAGVFFAAGFTEAAVIALIHFVIAGAAVFAEVAFPIGAVHTVVPAGAACFCCIFHAAFYAQTAGITLFHFFVKNAFAALFTKYAAIHAVFSTTFAPFRITFFADWTMGFVFNGMFFAKSTDLI